MRQAKNPKNTVTRRAFLKLSATVAGALALGPRLFRRASADDPKPKVVHVHSSRATDWDFASGWYGDHVAQDVVDEMVDWGVMLLTGTGGRAAAWQALLPDYASGQRIAIKVNLNNAQNELDGDNLIDALIQPVNGILRGLTEIGVAESDIWVFDAIRPIPERLKDGCAFPGVRFSGVRGDDAVGFSATERVTFQPPSGVPSIGSQRVSDVLVNADYVINLPILKKHCCAWVTLSFKNHLGGIEDCEALHDYIFPDESAYRSDYNPMLDLYKNRHFGPKTVLTVGDGLFGSIGHQSTRPEPWTSFGNRAPNSLFFSRDPVALDCVMYDFLEDEVGVEPGGDNYLALAAGEGLGVFEHRAAGAQDVRDWYSAIDYLYLDLEQPVRLSARCQERTAHLSWTQPPYPDLAGYHVYYTSESGGPAQEGPSPLDVADPGQLDQSLTELTMYAPYELWVEAYDGAGTPLAESNHVFVLPSDILIHLPLL